MYYMAASGVARQINMGGHKWRAKRAENFAN